MKEYFDLMKSNAISIDHYTLLCMQMGAEEANDTEYANRMRAQIRDQYPLTNTMLSEMRQVLMNFGSRKKSQNV
jgi:hypothetical protein